MVVLVGDIEALLRLVEGHVHRPPELGVDRRAEIALDGIMKPWDCAALVPIVREAGGTFTDWSGAPTISGGDGLSTNGVLLEAVVKVLEG